MICNGHVGCAKRRRGRISDRHEIAERPQVYRASDYESGGREFESLRARQFWRCSVRIARHSHGSRALEGITATGAGGPTSLNSKLAIDGNSPKEFMGTTLREEKEVCGSAGKEGHH